MDVLSTLPAFLLAVLLISASPGPAMALIFRRAALRGLSGAVPTVLGLELGLYCWALFAGAGFAALVAASEGAYLVLRVVGAAVLFYLGVRAFRAAWLERKVPQAEPAAPPAPGRRRWWGAFGEGVVVQLANPKAAIFMIAFYPQFVRADRGFWCLPEVDLGMPFAAGMSALIRARLTPQAAHEAMITGRRYGGGDALAAGIVDQVAAEDRVREAALELARPHAAKAGPNLAGIRAGMYGPVLEALRRADPLG
jgi:threonine/homoserine/homoserine lactone efflux protein